MTTRPPHPRPGLGLTEVLVALFVMALGLIGILTLFPIGAMSIAHGLKDDRCTETALQADGFMRAYWKANVVESTAATGDMNPTTGFVASFAGPTTGASNPVLLDPVGVASSAPATIGALARKNLDRLGSDTQLVFRTCTLLDDRTFAPDGSAETPLTRLARYSWAAVVQLPDATVPAANQPATFQVLVFENRALGFTPPGSEALVTGRVPQAPAGAAVNSVRQLKVVATDVAVADASALPLARKGGWVCHLDMTGTPRRADFYRVSGVETVGTDLVLDLDRPIQVDSRTSEVSIQVLFLAGLAEVYSRPPLGTTRIQ